MTDGQSTVLITGATGKLGRTFALGFAALGWRVAFTSRGGKAAQSLIDDCLDRGAPEVSCVEIDLTDAGAAKTIAGELGRRAFQPGVLINNARDTQYVQPSPEGRMSRGNWIGELTLGVVLPYELTMELADLQPSRLTKVINIASMYGVTAPNLRLYDQPELDSPVNYGVTKAGLIHLTKELAVRMAHRQISVNAISYGGVSGRAPAEFRERYAQLCPTGRMLDDAEVFGAVRFLASSDSAGMTGHNLVVDGGWTVW